MTFSLKQSGRAMSKHDTDTSDQHAAKRRWLNAHEEGYHKAMGN
ncbi:asparagine permease, partial [Escherichia coli]